MLKGHIMFLQLVLVWYVEQIDILKNSAQENVHLCPLYGKLDSVSNNQYIYFSRVIYTEQFDKLTNFKVMFDKQKQANIAVLKFPFNAALDFCRRL